MKTIARVGKINVISRDEKRLQRFSLQHIGEDCEYLSLMIIAIIVMITLFDI